MTEPLDLPPDKDELKRRLPLEYLCAVLGISLDRSNHATCPFHEDNSPSFYLWDGDDGRTRWACQPCGLGGDHYDLIKRMRGMEYNDAYLFAVDVWRDLPADYVPPARQASQRLSDPSTLPAEVAEARMRAEEEFMQGVMSQRVGLAQEGSIHSARAWDAYLRNFWGWGISLEGHILTPHWDVDGNLTGCKVRQGRAKTSIPGSTYPSLYGAWHGRQHPDVLITEGESDAVWAGYKARDAGIQIDVRSLPSGAAQRVEAAWTTELKGARTIYLALDPDDPGVEATRRWLEHLATLGFIDIRVCTLPLGRDLRAAQPNLKHLLENARRPLQVPEDLFHEPGGYLMRSRDGQTVYPVTNWTVEPTAQLSGSDDPGYDVVFTHAGVSRRTVIRLADLESTRSLNKWANRQHCLFTATDKARVLIAERIKARGHITPEIFHTERVGLHEPPEEYSFAGPSVVYPTSYLGRMPWRYAPRRQAVDVTGRLLLPTTEQMNWRWIQSFLNLSSAEVMDPILAWLIGAARRTEVERFPLLFISGSSGAGKTTLAELALRLGGSDVKMGLSAATPFILLRTLSCSTSIPVFIDEWTRMSRKEAREQMQAAIPALYTGELIERGQADLNAISYRMTSPVIMAGEDTFGLDRENERIVTVKPSRATQNFQALQHIHHEPLQAFAQLLHAWLVYADDLPPFPTSTGDRITYNIECLRTGWQTLRLFLDAFPDAPELPAEPNLQCFDREDEPDENTYLTALYEGRPIFDGSGNPLVWADAQGRGTWVRPAALIGELSRRQIDIQLPGGSQAMLGYFRERYDDVVSKITTSDLSGKQLRANLIVGLHLPEEADGNLHGVGSEGDPNQT